MQLIPAIDLLGGRVVRLSQGAYDKVTAYADDPIVAARHWQAEGAERIHVVDLDAARTGRRGSNDIVAAVVAALDIPCQVAGGLRSAEDVERALMAGADRVVLGSALISRPELAEELVERHGPARIVAALDVRDGRALGDGWVSGARGVEASDHLYGLAESGIRWFAITAIDRDGGLSGPDMALLERLRTVAPNASIIASGGVGSLDDLRDLAAHRFDAVIVGRALYEGAFSLPDAIAATTA